MSRISRIPRPPSIFAEYPKLMKDTDADPPDLRHAAAGRGLRPARSIRALSRTSWTTALKTHHHQAINPANNLQTLADALPALGIVAAVLGVVKTMASIDKPPEILGDMIGSALVGTFLGVLLAYGMVGPFANRCQPGD